MTTSACLRTLFCLLTLLGLAQAVEPPTFQAPAGQELVPDVVFAERGGKPLRLEILRPRATPAQPMPVVLLIHGGGWFGGSHRFHAPWLAAEGYFTASVEYRLNGDAPWPAQLEDCRAAVRWLRAHAAEYHLDSYRFGCLGHSAGGHLAACLGVMADKKEFDGPGDPVTESARLQAVIVEAGPSEFSPEAGPALANLEYPPSLQKLFRGPYSEKPAVWRGASPALQVTAGAPPFLLIHGEQDTLVPIKQAERLHSALQTGGIPVEFIRIRNAGHSLKQEVAGGPPADPDEPTLHRSIIAFFDRLLKAP